MRKYIAILLTVLMVFAAQWAFAAGSSSTATFYETPDGRLLIMKIAWISDDTDGTVSPELTALLDADTTVRHWSQYEWGWIEKVVTLPDSTSAPTANYDITLEDANGFDILGGACEDRASATDELVLPTDSNGVPMPTSIYTGAGPEDTLTLTIENAGNTKAGTVYIYVTR